MPTGSGSFLWKRRWTMVCGSSEHGVTGAEGSTLLIDYSASRSRKCGLEMRLPEHKPWRSLQTSLTPHIAALSQAPACLRQGGPRARWTFGGRTNYRTLHGFVCRWRWPALSRQPDRAQRDRPRSDARGTRLSPICASCWRRSDLQAKVSITKK